jgi:hypothetical protein
MFHEVEAVFSDPWASTREAPDPNTVETPLNRLDVAEFCPGAEALEAFSQSLQYG